MSRFVDRMGRPLEVGDAVYWIERDGSVAQARVMEIEKDRKASSKHRYRLWLKCADGRQLYALPYQSRNTLYRKGQG